MSPHPELKVVCAWSDEDFLASLQGSFAGEAAVHFGEILLLESWRGLARIALDLAAVEEIDLLGLTALWRVAESIQDLGGVLEVQGVPDTVGRRLTTFGITERVLTVPDGEVRSLLGTGPLG